MPPFQYEQYRNPYVSSIASLLEAPGQIEAQRAMNVGISQANAARQRGAIFGGAVQDASGIAGNALQQYAQWKAEAPKRAAELASIQSLTAERNSLTGERNQQTAARAQTGIDQATIGKILATGGDLDAIRAQLKDTPDARLIPQIEKSFDEANKRKADYDKTLADIAKSKADAAESQAKVSDAHANFVGGIGAEIAKHGYDPSAFVHGVAFIYKDSIARAQNDDEKAAIAQEAGQAIAMALQSPDQIKPFVDARIAASPEQRAELARQAAIRPPATPNPTEASLAVAASSPDPAIATPARAALALMREQHPPQSQPETLSDVKESVAGMMDGTLPPILPGRATKEYMQLLAEAHRQKYDLAAAATDWAATQKHIATLNGAQQTRLNQSINALPELLDTVDDLASKWKGGRFPVLNRANLALAKGGAYGNDVATVARQLDSQIADVTADLGAVYMGGNSPTDHALELAGKSLSGDWSETVLKDMVALARKNVIIRRNSIKNTGVQGASADNPYVPPSAPVVPAAAPPPRIVRYDMNGQIIP